MLRLSPFDDLLYFTYHVMVGVIIDPLAPVLPAVV